MRANRLPVRFGPADAPEGHFGFRILHRENGSQREGLGLLGQEEMLGHLDTYRF
jgi:hypothetical protein